MGVPLRLQKQQKLVSAFFGSQKFRDENRFWLLLLKGNIRQKFFSFLFYFGEKRCQSVLEVFERGMPKREKLKRTPVLAVVKGDVQVSFLSIFFFPRRGIQSKS